MKKFIQFIYKLIPFKKELFSVLRIFWKPSESLYKHLHFKGVFNIKVNQNVSFKMNHYGFQLENEIFWSGLTNGWEKESIKIWLKLCQQSNVILDIGANTGVYALIAKAVNPSSTVYAFEPVARVFEKLNANIALNQFEIVAIEKAISNTTGQAIIYDTDTPHTYSVAVNKNIAAKETAVFESTIETITMDKFIETNSLEKIDLIKIDVETHEPEVLEGFGNYLSQFKPTMLIEILNDDIGNKIEQLVDGLNYVYFNIDERGGIKKVEKITKSDYYNYLICSPKVAEEIGLI